MYSIYSDGVCIYNDVNTAPEIKMIDPTLTLADNTAGTLKFKLPQSNVGYDSVNRISSIIKVYKEGKEIWAGRVISEDIDFWNNRSVTCEGELGYLNDTAQFPPEQPAGGHDEHIDDYGGAYYFREGETSMPGIFLDHILAVHNSKVEVEKQFELGNVTVTDPMINEKSDEEDTGDIYVFTDYISTLECIKTKLIDKLGGHFVIRKENGKRYLDYLAEYHSEELTQTIEFRKNLLDFTRTFNESDFATVIIPLGKQLDVTANTGGTEYPTIEDVNQGKNYLKNDEAVAAFGWIERIVNFDDIEDEQELLDKGREYLEDLQFENLTLKLNAYDLHYLDNTIEDIRLLDQVRVISRPHGLNRVFPITELELNLANPSGSTFTLGEEKISTSLSSYTNQVAGSVSREFKEGWHVENKVESSILGSARRTASSLINNATRGYITITHDTEGTDVFYIANEPEHNIADATKFWKWTLGGLGYYDLDQYPDVPTIAITGPDGGIVASSITTGTMLADRVRAGLLQSQNGNVSWNLSTGVFKMNQGSINIGSGKFVVTDEGNLEAKNATITGNITANTLTATNSGKIGPLTINNDTLSYGSIFSVDGTGKLTASGAVITGDSTFRGTLNGATGTFSGNLDAAGGIFAGELSAATGSFTGTLTSSSINVTGGSISGTNVNTTAIVPMPYPMSSYNMRINIDIEDGRLWFLKKGVLPGLQTYRECYMEGPGMGTDGTLFSTNLYIVNNSGYICLGGDDTYAGAIYLGRTENDSVYSHGIHGHINTGNYKANMYIDPTTKQIQELTNPLIGGTSSIRYKNSIEDINSKSLDPRLLYGVKIRQFKFNKDYISDKNDERYDRLTPGFIAEELEEIYPRAVFHENGKAEGWDLTVIVPPMLALIQEQHKDIEQLKSEIERLKNE